MGLFRQRQNRRIIQTRKRRIRTAFFDVVEILRDAIGHLPVVLGALVIIGVGVFLGRFVLQTPYFQLRTVNFEGTVNISPEQYLEHLGFEAIPHTLRLSPRQVRQTILQHPWVEDAQVRVELPDQMLVRIVEREPQALLLMDNLFLVDRDGHVFSGATDFPHLWNMPVITGLDRELYINDRSQAQETIREALELVFEYRNRHLWEWPGLSEINLDEVMGYSVVTTEPATVVYLGSRGHLEKLDRLELILEDLQKRGEVASAVYLDNEREPERVVVRLAANFHAERATDEDKRSNRQ